MRTRKPSSVVGRGRQYFGAGLTVGLVLATSLQGLWYSLEGTVSNRYHQDASAAEISANDEEEKDSGPATTTLLTSMLRSSSSSNNNNNNNNHMESTIRDPTWPGIPKHELGHALVAKSTNFVQHARHLTLHDYLDDFLHVYEARPDPVNLCGIRINHALALYVTVKVLQPTTIIESGVNAGQSTYFMRAAAENTTKIYAIDPLDTPVCGQAKRWIDTINTEYYTGKDFVDITEIDWDSKIKSGQVDPLKTLVFLDDHLVVFDRIGVLLQHGFRHVLLEDNYKAREGATPMDKAGFTPKQMFRRIDEDSNFLWNNLISYAEFPPLIAPILAKANKSPRKAAGGFMVAADTNQDIVEPILRAERDATDREIYERICRQLQLDPEMKDNDSYMQLMNYNQIAYFELLPWAPRLRRPPQK